MSSLNPEFYAPYNYSPDVSRARHNLSTKRAFTVQTGALVPVLFHRLYKGDDFKIRPMTLLQSILPLNRQLLDCFELRVETYLCPLTNYYGWMDNNSRNDIEQMAVDVPKWKVSLFGTEYDDSNFLYSSEPIQDAFLSARSRSEALAVLRQHPNIIQKGSMFQHIGVPAGFAGSGDITDAIAGTMFNAVNIERILCYLDIVRCYHVNTQYEDIPFYAGRNWEGPLSSSDLFAFPFSHQDLDNLFVDLRYASNDIANSLDLFDNSDVGSIGLLIDYLRLCNKSQGGFFPVQHRPDLWRNLLSASSGNVNARVVRNEDGTINVHEIQDKSHLQSLYDSWYLSGGRYNNLLRTSFGMRSHHHLHMPQLLSVDRHLIDPSNVTASASSGDYELGEKAANVDKFNSGGYVRVRPDVDSYLVVVASITPLPAYSQGFEPDVCHLSFNDDFTPELQGMSFESIPLGYYTALPQFTVDPDNDNATFRLGTLDNEVGKNVKWMHYRTDVNRCFGEFTPYVGEYDDMVLSRRYTQLANEISGSGVDSFIDIGPYVNPLEYNSVFNHNSVMDEPWSLHISFDVKAKRPILKRIKPSMA